MALHYISFPGEQEKSSSAHREDSTHLLMYILHLLSTLDSCWRVFWLLFYQTVNMGPEEKEKAMGLGDLRFAYRALGQMFKP